MIYVSRSDSELNARIVLPASKSISNRLLILQFLYGGQLQAGNLSGSGDTVLLASLLESLRQYLVREDKDILRLDARNAGTAFRFLTALLSVTPGRFFLTGSGRMTDRPVGPLVDALREIGADIRYAGKTGFPPLRIGGGKLSGGHVKADASLSSQFLSALLLIAPTLEGGLVIDAGGEMESRPYSRMTLKLLGELGIPAEQEGSRYRIGYKPQVSGKIEVEPDWSAASFWYCMLAAAESGSVFFPGLNRTGLQGDEIAADLFNPLGIVTEDVKGGIRIRKSGIVTAPDLIDFTECPDLALPVIVACTMTGCKAWFTGLERLRIKESDRLAVMQRELPKTGMSLQQSDKGTWALSGQLKPGGNISVDDEEDHRVAMAFSAFAMKGFRLAFKERDVVDKSYPYFWHDLQSSEFVVVESC